MKTLLTLSMVCFFTMQILHGQTLAKIEENGTEAKIENIDLVQPAKKSVKGIPAGGYLLIPDSGSDNVLAFDPQTGDLVDADFIVASGIVSTPIQILQSQDKTKLYLSDQIGDAVYEFDTDGNFIGLFAPAGGPNPAILDNVRGMAYMDGTDHILVCDGNNDVVSEFDNAGNFVGSFTAPGLVDPFDIVFWPEMDQYLVCDISGGNDADALKLFNTDGSYDSDFASGLDFPEQVSLTPGGNVLVATFTSPNGVYEYMEDGTLVGYYDVTGASRGVYELPNGNMLVTSGDGVYEVSKTNQIVETKYQASGASMRFISFAGPSSTTVTFQVDMSQQTVPPEGVHIAGSFQGWEPGATAMIDAGNNIYTYSMDFAPGESIEYKYVNGDEWGEEESVPPGCAQNNNRYLTVPASNTVLVAVCFASCNPCGNPTDVTLQVDMSEQTVSTDGVHVAGSFQGWDPAATEMIDQGNGMYEVTVSVNEGESIEYKFINGADWSGEEIVPAACGVPNGVGGYNRFYDVPAGGGTTDEVCFSSCDPCGVIVDEYSVTFRVDMSEETVSTDGIHIAGSFQGWDPAASELTDVGDNVYEIEFMVPDGDHLTFKYINGNDWPGAESVPEECGEDDGNGGYNRFFDVPANDVILDLVCFSSCSECAGIVTPTVNVTFVVDMSEQIVSGEGVHVAGEFQGWDPGATELSNIGNNLYSVTVEIDSGSYNEYKFINGITWDGAEIVPEECGVDDGNGGFNRFIDEIGADSTLMEVCFSSCIPCETGFADYQILNGISVSPNPFRDELVISSVLNDVRLQGCKIYNSFGQVCIEENSATISIRKFTVNVAQLPAGIYFLQLDIDKNGQQFKEVRKLIKQ